MTNLRCVDGVATRREVVAVAGERALLPKASTLRPSLERPTATQLGYQLGRSPGVRCWASVEDSILLLGPPRSGKGTSVVIPMILGSRGPVVTTSTRPDNLAARRRRDRVAVFDPQSLAVAPGITHPSAGRWSEAATDPRRRCCVLRRLSPQAAGWGVENGSFWRQQSLAAVRCLLLAAALDQRLPSDLYRWSHSAAAAKEAVAVLTHSEASTPGWDRALDAMVSSDQRTRDSVWAMAARADAKAWPAATETDLRRTD